jgi:hypothetical protein
VVADDMLDSLRRGEQPHTEDSATEHRTDRHGGQAGVALHPIS